MTTPLRLAAAYSVSEIRAVPHDLQRVLEIILLPSKERYLFAPGSELEDDGVEVLEPSEGCRCCAGRGRWLRWAVSGGGGGVTDHGALTGLEDDDHPQYQTEDEVEAQIDARASDADPQPIGDPDPGVSTDFSRADHVHPGGDAVDVVIDVDIVTDSVVKTTGGNFNTASTTGAQITGTGLSFTLAEETEVFFSVHGTLAFLGGGDFRTDGALGIYDGAAYHFGGNGYTSNLGYAIDFPGALVKRVTLPAGSYTVYAALKSTGNNNAEVRIASTSPLTFQFWYIEKTKAPFTGGGGPHAYTHEPGGPDELVQANFPLDEWGPTSDTTENDATDTAHGLLPKLPADANMFFDGDGNWRFLLEDKGDLLTHDGTDLLVLPVGADGKQPMADSAAASGLSYRWSLGALGAGIFGPGVDGDLTVSGTTTVAADVHTLQYDDLAIGSSGLLQSTSSTQSHLVLFARTLDVASGGVLNCGPITGAWATQRTGGAGGGGGGAGGAGGRPARSLWLFVREITGSGTIKTSAEAGVNGSNATTATATANGSAGGFSGTADFRLWNIQTTTWLNGGGSGAGGGGSNGTGGAAGALGSAKNVETIGALNDYLAFLLAGTPSFSSSTAASPTVAGANTRCFFGQPGGGGGSGGRNNGGAQAGAGGGSGAAWQGIYSTGTAGATGGAGAAGGSGAGGGGGGAGGPGGLMFIWSMSIAATLTFSCNGAAAGNGGNGIDRGGGGAAGPGGTGGYILCFTPLGCSATLSADGGAKGTVGAHGSLGGSDGNLPADAQAGVTRNIAMAF